MHRRKFANTCTWHVTLGSVYQCMTSQSYDQIRAAIDDSDYWKVEALHYQSYITSASVRYDPRFDIISERYWSTEVDHFENQLNSSLQLRVPVVRQSRRSNCKRYDDIERRSSQELRDHSCGQQRLTKKQSARTQKTTPLAELNNGNGNGTHIANSNQCGTNAFNVNS